MSYRNLLQQIIGVTLVTLFLVGCGAPTATPTPVPATQISIPATPTPAPTPTSIPTPYVEGICHFEYIVKAWIDENADGVWDEGEAPLSGVIFHFNSDSYGDVGRPPSVSDENGSTTVVVADYPCYQCCSKVEKLGNFVIYPTIPLDYHLTTADRVPVVLTSRPRFGFAPGEPTTYHHPEEYAVYSALLGATEDSEVVVIEDHTVGYGRPSPGIRHRLQCQYYRNFIPELDPNMCVDFLVRNVQPYPLEDRFSLFPGEVLLVSRTDVGDFFQHGAEGETWDGFYERYPHSEGFVTLSRVGFNEQMDKALVHLNSYCGPECGTGEVYYLVKLDGQWHVKASKDTWEE